MSSDSEPLRRLPIEGAYNVRDLGGYPIRAGGSTRWKTFLRSDSTVSYTHLTLPTTPYV